MNTITDKIGFRKFLTRVFIANSGVSSRRVLAFLFSIVLIFLMFFKYSIDYCWLTATLIGALLALTTISSYGQKSDGESQDTNKG